MFKRPIGRSGRQVPVIGQGTWKFGENPAQAGQEIDALQAGLELGMTLIDTAEEYAKGGSERIVGQAIQGRRDDVFLVTKVSARNSSYRGVLEAAESSLKRLNTGYLDLYLHHWPNEQVAIAETMEAMAELVNRGWARHVGVSNYSVAQLQEAQKALGNIPLSCNQVPYHLNDRRIERDLYPYCHEHDIVVMGYSPFGYAPQVFGQAGFPEPGTPGRELLEELGRTYGKTAYQIALNWAVRLEGMISIPKALRREHLQANADSVGWTLDPADAERLDRAFPQA